MTVRLGSLSLIFAQVTAAAPVPAVIRINQLGYLPDAPKVAVFCSLTPTELRDFLVSDATGKRILQQLATPAKPFGPCVVNYRLHFSALRKPGEYPGSAGGVPSPIV